MRHETMNMIESSPKAPSAYLVSLTTYLPRFEDVHLTIESLLEQECSYGYAVHLYLSRVDIEKNKGLYPLKLEALIQTGGG